MNKYDVLFTWSKCHARHLTLVHEIHSLESSKNTAQLQIKAISEELDSLKTAYETNKRVVSDRLSTASIGLATKEAEFNTKTTECTKTAIELNDLNTKMNSLIDQTTIHIDHELVGLFAYRIIHDTNLNLDDDKFELLEFVDDNTRELIHLAAKEILQFRGHNGDFSGYHKQSAEKLDEKVKIRLTELAMQGIRYQLTDKAVCFILNFYCNAALTRIKTKSDAHYDAKVEAEELRQVTYDNEFQSPF